MVVSFYRIAGFAGKLLIDSDLAGENGAFGLFPALAESTLNQCLIQSAHATTDTHVFEMDVPIDAKQGAEAKRD
jgi:hypothetical protein